jgi:hypothetical protein
MVSRMTPTLPSPTSGSPVIPAPDAGPPEGAVGALIWYLATCHQCGADLAQPFHSDVERDDWAAKHVEATGHVVLLSVDAFVEAAPPTRVIRPSELSVDGSGFKFLCVGPGRFCARWNGPYATPQLALAASRAHACEPKP